MARPRSFKRDDVVAKSAEMFRRLGYEGAHLAELVQFTGLNRFSLYKEFGGKAGLYQAALAHDAELLLARYRNGLTRAPLGLENVGAMLKGIGSTGDEGQLVLNTLMQQPTVPPEAFSMALETIGEVEALYQGNLVGAASRSQLNSAVNLAGLGRLVQTIDHGLHVQGRVGTTPAQQQRIVDALMSMLSAQERDGE